MDGEEFGFCETCAIKALDKLDEATKDEGLDMFSIIILWASFVTVTTAMIVG